MKKFLVLSALAGATAAASLQAATYTDIQYRNAYVDEDGRAITGTFNIVTPGSSTYTISGYASGNGTFSDQGGYVVGTDLIGLVASFYIKDDSSSRRDGREKVDIDLGWCPPEINNLELVNGGKTLISFGGSSALISFLEDHGRLSYRIEAERGDFKLEYAMLSATTRGTLPSPLPGTRVPDGGATVGFLGLGLLGLFGAARNSRSR